MTNLNIKKISSALVLMGLLTTHASFCHAEQKDETPTTNANPTKKFDNEAPKSKRKRSKGPVEKRNSPQDKRLETPRDPEMRNRKEDVD